MGWKNKHFDREAVFQEQPRLVFEAARSFAAESLAGWRITDTADGFEARGNSASHSATAKFRVEPTPSGTKVAVTLLVERAGLLGFMLYDIGGYYDGQIRKWLEGIQRRLHQGATSATRQDSLQQERRAIPKATGTRPLYVGCMVALLVFPFLLFCVTSVIGLITGHLYLFGRRGETINGPLARIISGIFLAVVVLIVLSMFKSRKRAREQN